MISCSFNLLMKFAHSTIIIIKIIITIYYGGASQLCVRGVSDIYKICYPCVTSKLQSLQLSNELKQKQLFIAAQLNILHDNMILIQQC